MPAILVFHGETLYGKVDQVPGLLHVATPFMHLQFFPLIPKGQSFIVLEKPIPGLRRRVPIRQSLKSIWIAWARPMLMIVALISLAIGLSELLQPKIDWAFALKFLVPGILCVLLFLFTYRLTRASCDRAIELAKLAGIPREEIVEALGRMDPSMVAEVNTLHLQNPEN